MVEAVLILGAVLLFVSVSVADQGATRFSAQTAIVFEADYFTATAEPSLQLECVGAECDNHHLTRVRCEQRHGATPATLLGCPEDICGKWYCNADGLGSNVKLSNIYISCLWEGEGIAARGSCALQHSFQPRLDSATEESDQTRVEEPTTVEKSSEEPECSQPSESTLWEPASNFSLSGSDVLGPQGVLAIVLSAIGTVIFCALSCKARWERQVSTQTITPDERKEIAKLFTELDTDGSGGLDIDEMKVALTNLGFRGVTDQQLNALMFEADLDGNGQIEEEELVALLGRYKKSGKVDFRSTVQQVLTRDMQHFRRNWADEAYQFASLLLILAVMMAVLFKIGEYAEQTRKYEEQTRKKQ